MLEMVIFTIQVLFVFFLGVWAGQNQIKDLKVPEIRPKKKLKKTSASVSVVPTVEDIKKMNDKEAQAEKSLLSKLLK